MTKSYFAGALGCTLLITGVYQTSFASDLFTGDPYWTYSVYGGYYGVVCGELTDDSIPDLVLSEMGNTRVKIFEGNGDGSFSLLQTLSSIDAVWSEISDVDGDGDMDLIQAVESVEDSIFVMLNDGSGIFSDPISSRIQFGSEFFAVSNFDSDLLPDLVVCANGLIYLLHGNGDGSFQEAEPLIIYDEYYGTTAIDLADLDNDSDQDIVVLAGERISVLFNNGDGSVSWGGYYGSFPGPIYGIGNLVLTHLNQDTFLDVVLAAGVGIGSNTIFTLVGNDVGAFNSTGPGWLDGHGYRHVIASDFDLDGFEDFLFVGTSGSLDVMLSSGDGLLQYPPEFSTGGGTSSVQAAVDDFDQDGDYDFAYIGSTDKSKKLIVQLNQLVESGIEDLDVPENSVELSVTPSPFSSSVSIGYCLSAASHCNLSVYDVTGRMVDCLENSLLLPGEHSLVWNPDNSISPGCYMIVLDTGTTQAISKCLKI